MGTEFITKDTGRIAVFDTGAVRNKSEGKGRYDLLPMGMLRRLAGVYERGAKIYAANNWRKGMPMSRCLDSALRHTFQYAEGYRDEDHLAQAIFNLAALIEYDEMIRQGRLPPELNDLLPSIEGSPPTNAPELLAKA